MWVGLEGFGVWVGLEQKLIGVTLDPLVLAVTPQHPHQRFGTVRSCQPYTHHNSVVVATLHGDKNVVGLIVPITHHTVQISLGDHPYVQPRV